ncbi:hypothetical protein ERC79_12030 [Rhodococcus sp. ABRD24]|uniref:hypothetical protein n=1 Tax=Rhodococcus sp. ABRD24 TaxID=2507582 RepID=UPI00103D7410|nr:hypothetical protein [Rhodococcus sp. ABRD24]QBJ96614.1 hypothetical protein ERC79_12030 [Rhodococcus sp. ABRD24]
MRKTLATAGVAASVTGLLLVPGVVADAASADTTVTFSVTGLNGGLDLSVPDGAPLTWVPGQDGATALAPVSSVRDRRNGTGVARAFLVTASITDLTNSQDSTIPKNKVTYTAIAPTTGAEGTGAQALGSPKVVLAQPGHGLTDITVQWTPKLSIDRTAIDVIGNCSATLTHSVA